MKQRIFSLFVLLGVVQGLAAQLISFGSVEQLGVGLKVSFHNNYLYVATAQGLYVRDVENAESDWVKLPFTDYAVKDFTVRRDSLIALTKSNLYYSTDGGITYKEVSKESGTGATSFVEVKYSLPQDVRTSSLCLKVEFSTSNTQAIIDEFELIATN